MRRSLRTLLAALVLPLPLITGVAAATGSARIADTISVVVDPAEQAVVLGESMDLRITVTNDGAEASPPLVVHIDITDPTDSASVDPEDWSPTLSKTIGVVGPSETATVDWTIQPISAGQFSLYAVALAPGADTVASSNILAVAVDDQRSLNPGGILPVAIAVPAMVGALLLIQTGTARRTRSQAAGKEQPNG